MPQLRRQGMRSRKRDGVRLPDVSFSGHFVGEYLLHSMSGMRAGVSDDNLTVNLRPWGADLVDQHRPSEATRRIWHPDALDHRLSRTDHDAQLDATHRTRRRPVARTPRGLLARDGAAS